MPELRREDRRLTLQEARRSPCLECTTSPCCSYLVLRTMELTELADVDYLQYLLNFEGLRIGFAPNGGVRVYLRQACRHLDVDSGLCGVHGTDDQPSICVHYADHTCKYRHIMLQEAHPAEVILDRRRLGWWVEQIVFDDDRHLVDTPEWDDILAAFEQMPLDRDLAPPPPPNLVTGAWHAVALTGAVPDSGPPRPFWDPTVSAPCDGCQAWCCSTLVFSRSAPSTASELDFFRYCLGFPGVRIGIAEDGWALVVDTSCRHLAGGRCSVYGTDERPLRCSSYDELKCTYREHFGQAVPERLVLVGLEDFASVTSGIAFDGLGQVTALADLDTLRGMVAEGIRDRAAS